MRPSVGSFLGAGPVSHWAWVCVLVVFATGCHSSAERGYYAPVGREFGDSLQAWTQVGEGISTEVACQGVYLNTVDSRDVLTAHIQLEMTRTRAGEMLIPISAMKVDFVFDDRDPVSLNPSEVWSGRNRVIGTMLMNPWSRKSFDLFFDSLDPALPIPRIVRFRWFVDAGEGSVYGDCQFQRISAGDPRIPEPLLVSDAEFGMRNGYYLPGYGDLGTRRLRDSVEARPHYLFHAP